MNRILLAIVMMFMFAAPARAQQARGVADENVRNALGLGENEVPAHADDIYDDNTNSTAADDTAGDDSANDAPPPPPSQPASDPVRPGAGQDSYGSKESAGRQRVKEKTIPDDVKAATSKSKAKAVNSADDLGLALFSDVEASTNVSAQFLSVWEQRRQALKQHDNLKAASRLSMLNQLFSKYGGDGALDQSLRGIALALAREAQTALKQNDILRAIALSESAAQFAPELPPVQFTLARVRFARAPGNPASYIKAWRQGLQGYMTDMGSLFGVVLSLVLLFAGMLLLSNFVFALSLFIKTLKLAVHDLSHLLPRGVSGFQFWLLLILLGALPVLLRLGPVYIALCWLLMAWPYLVRRERFVAALMQVLGLSLFAWVYVMAVLLGPSSQDTIQMYNATKDLAQKSARAQLMKKLEQQPKDPVLLASLGLLAKRDGDLKKASAYEQQALSLEPDWAWLHNNLGNILVLQGKTDAGLNAYRRASEIKPSLFAAAFNTSEVYFRQRKMAQGQAATMTAKSIDPKSYARFKGIADAASKRAYNQVLVDVPMPQTVLLTRMFNQEQNDSALRDDLASMFYAGLSLNSGVAVHLGLIVLLLLVGLLSIKLRPSHACPRCGQAACVRCSAELPRQDVCAQCFHAFLAPSKDIDAALKVRKEIAVRRYLARRGRMIKVLSLLVPGLGHIYAAAPLRAAMALLVVSGLVIGILFVAGLVPMLFVVKASWPMLSFAGLAVAYVIVALLGLLSASKLED